MWPHSKHAARRAITAKPFAAAGIAGSVFLVAGYFLGLIPHGAFILSMRLMLVPLLVQFGLDLRRSSSSSRLSRMNDPRVVFWIAVGVTFLVVFLLAGETGG
jgi:uncharacterized membrane protein YesL